MTRIRMFTLLALPPAMLVAAPAASAASQMRNQNVEAARAPAPASPGGFQFTGLLGGVTQVTTSTHHTVGLSVAANSDNQTPSASIAVQLAKGGATLGRTGNTYESHTWELQVPRSDFTSSASGAHREPSVLCEQRLRHAEPPLRHNIESSTKLQQRHRHHVQGPSLGHGEPELAHRLGERKWRSHLRSECAAQYQQRCISVVTTFVCAPGILWSSPPQMVPGGGGAHEYFFGTEEKISGQAAPISTITGYRFVTIKPSVGRVDMAVAQAPVPTLSGQSLKITTQPNAPAISGGAQLTALSKGKNYAEPCQWTHRLG